MGAVRATLFRGDLIMEFWLGRARQSLARLLESLIIEGKKKSAREGPTCPTQIGTRQNELLKMRMRFIAQTVIIEATELDRADNQAAKPSTTVW